MRFLNSLNRFGRSLCSQPRRQRPEQLRSRPRIEPLEDRLVPTTGAVISLADSGPGTLRQLVSTPGIDTICFRVPGVIHLTTGEIQISKNLSIIGEDGLGHAVPVTIDGSNQDRIFEVAPGKTVTIKELTLTDGYARLSSKTVPGTGGAILNEGNLTVDTVTFNFNRAWGSGGAIETTTGAVTAAPSSASLTITSCGFKGNRAITGSGGAISVNDGQREQLGIGNELINVVHSTFSDNWAALDGGAINFDLPYYTIPSAIGALTVASSTFQGNEAADGGGIYFGANHPATGAGLWEMKVLNSTFDSNAAFGALTSTSFRGNGGAIDLSLILAGNTTAITGIQGSSFTGNWANFGGAISTIVQTTNNSTATVTIDQDSLSSNQGIWGGGIYTTLTGGSTRLTAVKVTNSTVDDNLATSFQTGATVYNAQGGGIFANVTGNSNTLLDLVNDTVAYNSAVTSTFTPSFGAGGGIYLTGIGQAPTVSLNSLTVAYNFAATAGGGLWVPLPFLSAFVQPWVRNCAFDLNTVGPGGIGPDVFGMVTSHGYNILSTSNPSFSPLKKDIQAAGDLKLATLLANNGGPTLTLMPQSGSPVLGNGFPSPAQFDDPGTDQRGHLRSKPTSRGAVDPP
jgi:hypothetical protein